MTLLNTAKALYSGALPAKAVYLGDEKIWPAAPAGGWIDIPIDDYWSNTFIAGTNPGANGDLGAIGEFKGRRSIMTRRSATTNEYNTEMRQYSGVSFPKVGPVRVRCDFYVEHQPTGQGNSTALDIGLAKGGRNVFESNGRIWFHPAMLYDNSVYLRPEGSVSGTNVLMPGRVSDRWVTVEVQVSGDAVAGALYDEAGELLMQSAAVPQSASDDDRSYLGTFFYSWWRQQQAGDSWVRQAAISNIRYSLDPF